MNVSFLSVFLNTSIDAVLSISGSFVRLVLAAVVAYALWAWIHSPHLSISECGRVPIVDPTNGNTKYSHRLKIANIGTRAAKNCEGTLSMRIPKSERVIRSKTLTHWLPTKADLVVDDEEQLYETTVPAGGSQKLEIFRQERTKNLKPNVVKKGRRFVETDKQSDWHAPIGEPIKATFQGISKSETNDIAETSSNLNKDDVKEADWTKARVNLKIEAESARPLEIDFNIYEDDGWIWVEPERQGWRRWVATTLYRVINRIRTGRWVSIEPKRQS